MVYVECPDKICNEFEIKQSLFLAGGISNCRNWQKQILEKIEKLDIVVFNPRRKQFDVTNKDMTIDQIKWEYEMLLKADVISFHFCHETDCPITLFELGRWAATKKELIISIDENYSRKIDVEVQMSLLRPDVKIVYSLDDSSKEIIKIFNAKKSIGYLNENFSGFVLNEKGRDLISSKITHDMKCKICKSPIFLMSLSNKDSLVCVESHYKHDTGWIINYDEMIIEKDLK